MFVNASDLHDKESITLCWKNLISCTHRRRVVQSLTRFINLPNTMHLNDATTTFDVAQSKKISSSVTVSTRVHVENIDFFMLMLISLYKHHPQKYESSKLQTRILARRCRASAKNIQIIISGYLYLPAVSVDKRDRSWKAAKRWKIVWSVERGGGKEQKLNSDTRAQKLIAFMSLRATFQFPFHRESSRKLLNGCWNSSRILRKKIVSSLFNLIWVLLCVLDCWWCDCFGVQRSFVRNKRKKHCQTGFSRLFSSVSFIPRFLTIVAAAVWAFSFLLFSLHFSSSLLLELLYDEFFSATQRRAKVMEHENELPSVDCRSCVLGHIKPSHFSFVMKVVHTKMLEPKKKRDTLENEKKTKPQQQL